MNTNYLNDDSLGAAKLAAQASTNREAALQAFMQQLAEINEQLEALHLAQQEHWGVDPETLTWGNVGDLKRIVSLLRQANGSDEA